jgi:DNA-binding response OmpR family regulator
MTRKITWIEDDADVIAPLVYPLEKEGFEVMRFSSIAEAKSSLKAIAGSDLILLDMILPPGPGQDATSRYPGLDLLREWRSANVVLPPVIALTVVSNPEVLADLKALLVANIIRKPALPSELQKRVHEVLRMSDPTA